MIPIRNAFQSNSHRFVSSDNTSILSLVFPNTAPRPFIGIYKALLLRSEFPTFYQHIDGVSEFFILRFNEEDTT